MSKKLIPIVFFAIISLGLYSQRTTLELTFTAENNGLYVRLDSIKVMNRTQGGDTVLYWPDTVLSIYYAGIPEMNKTEDLFQVFRNYPNPVADRTTISLFVPEKDKVSMIVTDITGHVILQSDRLLEKGLQSFRFTPGGANLYFFTAQWRGNSSSIKILQPLLNPGGTASLEYTGNVASFPQLKATEDIRDFVFSQGDGLLFIGYAGGLQSGMLDAPEESQTYTFQFATYIPCPGTPTVEYEGKIYSTIQVFSQCWLKQNLNVGTMIPGTMGQSNNGSIEKYCYNNEEDSCAKYGGLYDWWETMQYNAQIGKQGICPPGWHIPSDEEWKVLEGAVDSQYGIGDTTWDIEGYRGFDAGKNLKTIKGWYPGSDGADLFGFSALPGGYHISDSSFSAGYSGYWWSSSLHQVNYAWFRSFGCSYPDVYMTTSSRDFGFSERCIMDN
jgi:uncharacterized protein (TIGR02145 family)